MSSPIGHSLAGYIITALSSKKLQANRVRTLILCVLVANAPDLDFLPGIVIGKPNYYHHGISHSIAAGVIFSCILAISLNYGKGYKIKRDFMLFFVLYGSHLALDYISQDGRPPLGIPLFWPLIHTYYIFPYPVLPFVSHSGLDHATMGQFLKGIFSFHNVYVIFLELVLLAPFILTISIMKQRRCTKRHG